MFIHVDSELSLGSRLLTSPLYLRLCKQVAAMQDLQLYVCDPLTQIWKKLPLPSHVRNFNLVHLVVDKPTKQYTIIVADHPQNQNAKASVEVYDSTKNKWTTDGGIFKSTTLQEAILSTKIMKLVILWKSEFMTR